MIVFQAIRINVYSLRKKVFLAPTVILQQSEDFVPQKLMPRDFLQVSLHVNIKHLQRATILTKLVSLTESPLAQLAPDHTNSVAKLQAEILTTVLTLPEPQIVMPRAPVVVLRFNAES